MWKKITAVTMICILCAFFSFRITDAAEVSGTKQDVTDYKQISALISDTWDDDYFEKNGNYSGNRYDGKRWRTGAGFRYI